MAMRKSQSERSLTQRQEQMLALLDREGFVSVDALSQIFDVSEHTVRRDLDIMAQAGLITRVRGGAMPSKEAADDETVPNVEEKRRIGKAAAQLVQPGEILCIDAGSTTLEVAKNLPKTGISVLTNAVNIAYEIANQNSDIDVTLTGGSVLAGRGGERFGLSGPMTLQSLQQAGPVSKAIIGALGFDFDYGITDRWHYLAEVKRQMIEIAETVILVMDSSKIGKRYLEVISEVEAVDVLVTDDKITPEALERAQQQKIQVITC